MTEFECPEGINLLHTLPAGRGLEASVNSCSVGNAIRKDHAADDTGIIAERYYMASSVSQVLELSGAGVDEKHIFLKADESFISDSGELSLLGSVFGKCRITADGYEAFKALDRAAGETPEILANGRLLPVGIYVRTPGASEYDPVSFKQLQNISVRGCFLDLLKGSTSGGTFSDDDLTRLHELINSSYQTAKRLTIDVPCAMPFMCFKGVLRAMAQLKERAGSDTGFKTAFDRALCALETVSMQNSTAFYATFLAD